MAASLGDELQMLSRVCVANQSARKLTISQISSIRCSLLNHTTGDVHWRDRLVSC